MRCCATPTSVRSGHTFAWNRAGGLPHEAAAYWLTQNVKEKIMSRQ
jgi:hypothetical protein